MCFLLEGIEPATANAAGVLTSAATHGRKTAWFFYNGY